MILCSYLQLGVCFSFLIYSFSSPTPDLSIIFRPWSSYMCSITPATAKIGSSYGHMRGPGICCWFSDHSNCSQWNFEAALLPINPNIYIDQWEPIVIYHSITLLVIIQLWSPRCRHLLTPSTVVQCVDNHSRGLYCHQCYCICVCWGRPSRILHFSCWPGHLSTVLTKEEPRFYVSLEGWKDCLLLLYYWLTECYYVCFWHATTAQLTCHV